MNARARNRRTAMTAALEADIERVDEIWNDCRARFGAAGPWLFGEYSIADAMYAPVVLRFNTYGASISPTARWYMASVLEDARAAGMAAGGQAGVVDHRRRAKSAEAGLKPRCARDDSPWR